MTLLLIGANALPSVQRKLLLREERHRLERDPAVRVPDVIAPMVDAAHEFRRGHHRAEVVVEPALQRAPHDLVALARLGESGVHGRPQLVHQRDALAEIRERVGRLVVLVGQRIHRPRGIGADRVLVGRVGKHWIGAARRNRRESRGLVALDRLVGVLDRPVVVGAERDRNEMSLAAALAGHDHRVVVHHRTRL